MPEIDHPTRLVGTVLPERDFNIIRAYNRGTETKLLATLNGHRNSTNLLKQLHRSYEKAGARDLIGITKMLIESGELDPMEVARGHNLTVFNRLRKQELALIDYMTNAPSTEALSREKINQAIKSAGINYARPVDVFWRRIYPTVGAHNYSQLIILYKAYQNLLSQGMDLDYNESNFPTADAIENKAQNIGEKLSPEELLILKLHARGIFYTYTGNSGLVGQRDTKSEPRVTKSWVSRPETKSTFMGFLRRLSTRELNLMEFVDDRDLLRFRFVSELEREQLEHLIQPGLNIHDASYDLLRKKFGTATADHLAILYYTYKHLYPSFQSDIQVVTKTPEAPALIGDTLSYDQAQIFALASRGFNIAEIRTHLNLSRSRYEIITTRAFAALGISRQGRGEVEAAYIKAIIQLIDSGDFDAKHIAAGYDLTTFATLTTGELSVLQQLAQGETTIMSSTEPIRPLRPESLAQFLRSLREKTGGSTRMQLTALFRAYQNLLAQGYIHEGKEPVAGDRRSLGIEVFKRYLGGMSMSEAIDSTGHSYPNPSSLFSPIYQARGVHSQNELMLNLIATREVDLKEVVGNFDLIVFDKLTARELELCSLLLQGLGPQQISKNWDLQIEYTRTSLSRLYTKVGVKHAEQLSALFLLYQQPRLAERAAGQISELSRFDIVGVQITRLRFKGLSDREISRTLNINQEQMDTHFNRISVALGTASTIETLIELYRLGRIDVSNLVDDYNVKDFASLSDFQIGVLETLVCQDPRRYLTYSEKMSHYLNEDPEKIKESLRMLQLQIGSIGTITEQNPPLSPAITTAQTPEPSQEQIQLLPSEENPTPTKPPTERQNRFGEEVYLPYLERIYEYILRQIRDQAVAQELAQETFMYLYNRVDEVPEDKILPSLYATASVEVKKHFGEEPLIEIEFDPRIHDQSSDSTAELINAPTSYFEPIEISKLALLYMEYRRRLRFEPESLLAA